MSGFCEKHSNKQVHTATTETSIDLITPLKTKILIVLNKQSINCLTYYD